MPEPSLLHLAMFAAILAALIASAVLLLIADAGGGGPDAHDEGGSSGPPAPPPAHVHSDRDAPHEDAGEPSRLDIATATQAPAIERATRRYLSAFRRYETGELSPRVIAALRATSTPEFARALIEQPPRSLGRAPGRGGRSTGRASVEVILLPGSSGPPRARVSGATEGGETFGLLLELVGERWLVAGIAP